VGGGVVHLYGFGGWEGVCDALVEFCLWFGGCRGVDVGLQAT
jgi:hypothetical protein